MKSLKSNVVSLNDYRKDNAEIGIDEVKDFLTDIREQLYSFDRIAYGLFPKKHTLKDSEASRLLALAYEEELTGAAYWLTAMIEKADEAEAAKFKSLVKTCDKLIATNERTKKNIVDDLASRRHYENKRELMKLVGFALVTPVTTFNLVRAIAPTHPNLAWVASIGGGTIATTLAFQDQAEVIATRAKAGIADSPKYFKRAAKSARASVFSTALAWSVANKRTNEINTSVCRGQLGKPKTVHLTLER